MLIGFTIPTISFALLRIQLTITPLMPGNTSTTFTPDLPSSLVKAFYLFLSHPFTPFSSLGGALAPVAIPPPGSNHSSRTPITISIAIKTEAIVMPCSQSSVLIFLANEVSLSSTLAIVPLIPVIWLVSLPLRRSMLSCLTFRSSFSLVICFLIFSRMPSSYSGLSQILESLCFSLSICSSN